VGGGDVYQRADRGYHIAVLKKRGDMRRLSEVFCGNLRGLGYRFRIGESLTAETRDAENTQRTTSHCVFVNAVCSGAVTLRVRGGSRGCRLGRL